VSASDEGPGAERQFDGTALILCRHGRTDWNDLGRYQGQTDVSLNSLGRQQAEFLAQTLRAEPLAAVWSSDLARAAETAAAIARQHGLEVRQDPRLREIDQGRWEGLTVAQIRARDARLHDRWESAPLSVTLPDGESIAEVRRRALAALCEALRLHGGGLICLVTHKVVQTIIRCELTGEPLEAALRRLPPNGSFERVEVPTSFARGCAEP
jgi:broad specificity phosphatase PhoE